MDPNITTRHTTRITRERVHAYTDTSDMDQATADLNVGLAGATILVICFVIVITAVVTLLRGYRRMEGGATNACLPLPKNKWEKLASIDEGGVGLDEIELGPIPVNSV